MFDEHLLMLLVEVPSLDCGDYISIEFIDYYSSFYDDLFDDRSYESTFSS